MSLEIEDEFFEFSAEARQESWDAAASAAGGYKKSLAYGPQGSWTRKFEAGTDAAAYDQLANILSEFLMADVVRDSLVSPIDPDLPPQKQKWLLGPSLFMKINKELGRIRIGLGAEDLLKNPGPLLLEWSQQFERCEEHVRGLLADGIVDETRSMDLYRTIQKSSAALSSLRSELEKRSVESASEKLDQIVEAASSKAESVNKSAAKAQQAAGLTADAEMSTHFAALAKQELASANSFRSWTMVTMGVGGLAAAAFLFGPMIGWDKLSIAGDDYVHLVQRILVLAGLFSFAGYLSRQAHNHRTLANWASTLAVQLKTFDAYADSIQFPAISSTLRKDFASRVFGEQPGLKGESSSPDGETIINKAADLVAKIMPGDKS